MIQINFNNLNIKNYPPKSEEEYKISREYFFYKFLVNTKEYILEKYGRKVINIFNALLYEHHFELNFNNLENFKSEFDWVKETFPSECVNNYEDLKNHIQTQYENIYINLKSKSVDYSSIINDIPIEPSCILRNISQKDKKDKEVLLHMKYNNIEYISRGNQWTMHSREEMLQLDKLGFIEVFASPFNRSLKKFCAIFESDKDFGAIGSFENLPEILKNTEEINLSINPPSGYNLQKKVVEFCLDILGKKKCTIKLNISTNKDLFLMVYKSGFYVDFKYNDYCYDTFTKEFIKMTSRPWWNIILSSSPTFLKNKINLLYYPKISPFENPKIMDLYKVNFLKDIK